MDIFNVLQSKVRSAIFDSVRSSLQKTYDKRQIEKEIEESIKSVIDAEKANDYFDVLDNILSNSTILKDYSEALRDGNIAFDLDVRIQGLKDAYNLTEHQKANVIPIIRHLCKIIKDVRLSKTSDEARIVVSTVEAATEQLMVQTKTIDAHFQSIETHLEEARKDALGNYQLIEDALALIKQQQVELAIERNLDEISQSSQSSNTSSTSEANEIDDRKNSILNSVEESLDQAVLSSMLAFGNEASIDTPLIQRVKAIQGQRFTSKIGLGLGKYEDNKPIHFELKSLLPLLYKSNGEISHLAGKYFSIPDVPGFKTTVFQVITCYDFKTMTKFCYMIPVVSDTKETGLSSQTVTSFFVLNPSVDERDFVILHSNIKERLAFLYMGYLTQNKLKINKTPSVIHYESVGTTKANIFCSSTYDKCAVRDYYNDTLNIDKTTGRKEYQMDILEEAPTIIDPETLTPIRREIFYDESAQKYRAKITLQPSKQYLVISCLYFNKNGCSARVPLKNAEIARCYKLGLCEFPRDIIKAVEYFEKDGSASSLYEIAVLFRAEESISDHCAYDEYLQKAVAAGCENAIIETAINRYFESSEDDIDEITYLLANIKTNNGLKLFVLGYINEQRNPEESFSYYYQAAAVSYRPALSRLGIENITDDDQIKTNFENTTKDSSIANYCMGSVLFFGLDILPQKERGLQLLRESASAGCWRAAESLYYIYEDDPCYKNHLEAMHYLSQIQPHDISKTSIAKHRSRSEKPPCTEF